jgi:hypothetical protein
MINIEKAHTSDLLTDPWNYKIVDHLFNESSFLILESAAQSLMQTIEQDNRAFIHPYKFSKLGIDSSVYSCFIECANILLANVSSLLDGFPDSKKSSLGYFCLPHFGVSGPDYTEPVHTDSHTRALTVVTYILPEHNIGTDLYRTQDITSFVKTVEWKQNRTLMFTPSNSSWHTWHNTADISRITIDFTCHRLENLNKVLDNMRKQDKDNLIEWFLKEMTNGNLMTNVY